MYQQQNKTYLSSHNSNIGDSPEIVIVKVIEANLIWVEQILDSTNQIIPFEEIVRKWQIQDFVRYHSLIRRFPKERFQIIRDNNIVIETLPGLEKINVIQKKNPGYSISKIIYLYVRSSYRMDKTLQKWEDTLDREISPQQWHQIHTKVASSTICMKLRAFQYRLTNGIITTNDLRNKWDNTIKANCTFCQNEVETVILKVLLRVYKVNVNT